MKKKKTSSTGGTLKQRPLKKRVKVKVKDFDLQPMPDTDHQLMLGIAQPPEIMMADFP